MRSTRRSALRTIAGGSIALAAGPRHSTAAKPTFFTPAQLDTLAALVDLIIPRTDMPAASDVGVHHIIDRVVSAATPLQKPWLEGIARADAEAITAGAEAFSKLARTQQALILERAEKSGPTFFDLLKGSTIDAYYSTRDGLVTM